MKIARNCASWCNATCSSKSVPRPNISSAGGEHKNGASAAPTSTYALLFSLLSGHYHSATTWKYTRARSTLLAGDKRWRGEMQKLAIVLALCISFWQTTEPAKKKTAAVVTELRATKRLPARANHVCYDDDRSHRFEEFSLIAYQPDGKCLGWRRTLIPLGCLRSLGYQCRWSATPPEQPAVR